MLQNGTFFSPAAFLLDHTENGRARLLGHRSQYPDIGDVQMRLYPLLLVLLTHFASAQQVDFGALRALLAEHERAQLISGTILIAREEQVLFHESFGFADWEFGVLVTPETRFGIGSITKPMTGLLVQQLISEGKLEFTTPVNEFLPAFPAGERGTRVSIAHLLNHRSGTPHRVTSAQEESAALNAQFIVARIQQRGLLFEPGNRRLYSSAGYTALARVLELIEGKSYGDIVQERLFTPAGMERAINETGARLMDGRARAYRLGVTNGLVVKNSPPKNLRFLDGAGSIYASARDLQRLVVAGRRGELGQGAEAQFAGSSEEWTGYAGRTNGYEAWLDARPADGSILVFLSNLQSASNWQIREQILRHLEGEEFLDVPLPPPLEEQIEEAARILGRYGAAEIRREEDSLFRGENEFYPIADGEYYIPGSGTRMRFEGPATRATVLVHINSDGSERRLERSD